MLVRRQRQRGIKKIENKNVLYEPIQSKHTNPYVGGKFVINVKYQLGNSI